MSIYLPEDADQAVCQPAVHQEPLVFPPLTHQRLENCALAAWYPAFRSLTIKTKVIPLPEDFVSYLHADGVFVPGQS